MNKYAPIIYGEYSGVNTLISRITEADII